MRQELFSLPISDEAKVPLLKGMYLIRGKAKFQTKGSNFQIWGPNY